MDLRTNILTSAAYLLGIIPTLRRLYRPQYDEEAAMTAMLAEIDLNEQRALSQIASMARGRSFPAEAV